MKYASGIMQVGCPKRSMRRDDIITLARENFYNLAVSLVLLFLPTISRVTNVTSRLRYGDLLRVIRALMFSSMFDGYSSVPGLVDGMRAGRFSYQLRGFPPVSLGLVGRAEL